MIPPVPQPPRRKVVIPLRPSAALRVFRPWWFAVGAIGTMLFIAYGSYVPFELKSRAWDDATVAFQTALSQWNNPLSRSDFAANILLGLPLGFCLLGMLRVDRPQRWLTIALALGVTVACGLFAAVVEFGQLYFKDRTCSGADVTAQTIGGAIGAGGWVLFGQGLTDRLRRSFDSDVVRGTTAPMLCGYAVLLLVLQTLPLDLTASPYDIYDRLRDQVTWTPLGELFGRPDGDPDQDLKTLAAWCELFALYLPAGLLLAGMPGQFRTADGFFRVAGLGLLTGLILEMCQVLVVSRHPSTTDILIGAAGVMLGWATARILSVRAVRKLRVEVALLLGQTWAAVLAVVAWFPYEFFPGVISERMGAMSWLPLREAVKGPYLWAAEGLLAKFALVLPLGAVVAWGLSKSPKWVVWSVAVGVSLMVAAVLEFGQAMLPGRTVCPTDVLLAVVGGWVGAVTAGWVLKSAGRAIGGGPVVRFVAAG